MVETEVEPKPKEESEDKPEESQPPSSSSDIPNKDLTPLQKLDAAAERANKASERLEAANASALEAAAHKLIGGETAAGQGSVKKEDKTSDIRGYGRCCRCRYCGAARSFRV